MNIEGTYTFQSKLIEVRQSLTKKDALQHAIPGLEKLETVEKNRYTIALYIKYPPLSGTYQGQVSIAEDLERASYRFSVESNNAPNTIMGVGSIQLHEQGENTTLIYKGNLTLNKRGIRLTPAVTRGAIKLLIQQFFTSLSSQLRVDHANIVEDDIATDLALLHDDEEVPLPLASKVVRLLGLGKNNALQEEIWAQRLRRASLVSGFLFLVWIGMRIPRKR